MTSTTETIDPLSALAGTIDGLLVRPEDAGWDDARQAWFLNIDQRPTAVVLARSVRAVQETIATARRLGLRVAPQSTGHNAGPLGPLTDTILLKTSAMRGVHIDAAAQLARVEAGALWMDVTTAAGAHGLAALAGSSADVGVAGYTLGGGVSWLARSRGLAANSVVRIEVVTADGEVRTASAQENPDLFWALRGGGGSFAVVTALEFRLYPITEVYAGALFFPVERTAEMLSAWHSWVPSVPDTVRSVARVLHFPPLPELLPLHLSGQSFAVVEAACDLPAEAAEALLAPLRALGPAVDTFGPMPVTELATLHMDPPMPVPGHSEGMLVSDLSDAALAAFARVAENQRSLIAADIHHLGGALAPGRMSGGAVDSLDADFLLWAGGLTPDEESTRAVLSALEAMQHAMAPWSTGQCYLNFAERHRATSMFFDAETHARLQAIKATYDPTDMIRANHHVAPSSSGTGTSVQAPAPRSASR